MRPPHSPKTCVCGERIYSRRAKLKHQRECIEPARERGEALRREQARRDAAASSMEPESWQK